MADNTILNVGTGGDVIRDVAKTGGAKTPVSLIDIGGAGVEVLLAAGQAAAGTSIPVVISSDQVDGNNFVNVTLGTQLDATNDAISTEPQAFPITGSATTTAATSIAVTLTSPLGRDPDYHEAKFLFLTVYNPTGSGQTMTAGTLTFTDTTVGSQTSTILYTLGDYATVSIAPAANQTFVIPLLNGYLRVATLLMTFGGTATASQTVNAAGILSSGGGPGSAPFAAPSGGAIPHQHLSTADDNAVNLKARAGTIYGIQVFNSNATIRYVKLYNKATTPAPGSDTPVKTLLIPGSSSSLGAGVVHSFPVGLSFSTGIGYAIVLNMAVNDDTSVSSGDLMLNIDYK